MKKLLLLGAGLLSLCTVGLTTAKAGPDDNYYRRGDDNYYRPRPEYRERHYDERVYYPRHRVVVREYCAPRYYVDDCPPRYYHRRPRVGFFLPLPPLPLPPF